MAAAKDEKAKALQSKQDRVKELDKFVPKFKEFVGEFEARMNDGMYMLRHMKGCIGNLYAGPVMVDDPKNEGEKIQKTRLKIAQEYQAQAEEYFKTVAKKKGKYISTK